MQTKRCTKCNQEKNISEFPKQKQGKFGVRSNCNKCVKEWRMKYNQSDNYKKYREETKEKNREKNKQWRINNPSYNKTYYEENRKIIIKRSVIHNQNNPNYKIYQQNYHKNDYQKNKPLYRQRQKEKCNSNINYRLTRILRKRTWDALKENIKSKRTLELLGCSVEFLKKHLESQFTKNMSWNNYGYRGWHIDHIISCAKFDLSKPEEQKQCFHYSNLQPMWAEENWSKGANRNYIY